MAHLVDGILAAPVIVGGTLLAAGGLALGCRRLEPERIPSAGLLSAAFFVASLVHVPVGPWGMHPLLNGLLGVLLGWAAFPAIFVALLLQAMLFGVGGVTVLGVNTVALALPAVVAHGLYAARLERGSRALWGALAGGSAAAMTGALIALALAASGKELWPAAALVGAAYLPLVAVEAVLTATVAAHLGRVNPALLAAGGPARARDAEHGGDAPAARRSPVPADSRTS
jgi:cobalt/nickel transport system permease protein